MGERLTFHNTDGSFGVIGMNRNNQDEKLYSCVCKLVAYEDTNKTPKQCEIPDLCVGSVLPNGYILDANFCNVYILAHKVLPTARELPEIQYATWYLDSRLITHTGSYFSDAEEAQRHFAYLCFDWFQDKDRPRPELPWTDYHTHRIARYKGWLLLVDLISDDEDTIYLFTPDDAWEDPDILCDYDDVTSYEHEWEADSERVAIEFIDCY